MSLGKTLYRLLNRTGPTQPGRQEIVTAWLKIVDWDLKPKHKQSAQINKFDEQLRAQQVEAQPK